MKYTTLTFLLGVSFLVGSCCGALAQDDSSSARGLLYLIGCVTLMALGAVILN